MTRCKQQKLAFEPVAGRRVEGRFDDKKLSTDGGLQLVREVASSCRFFTRRTSCFIDSRNQDAITHKDPVKNSTRSSTANEVMQRIASRSSFELFADWASSSVKRANQIRLWFSTIAYLLLVLVRKTRLKGTHLATAEAHTLRVRLIKCAVQVTVSVRRIYLSFTESFPSKDVLAYALQM